MAAAVVSGGECAMTIPKDGTNRGQSGEDGVQRRKLLKYGTLASAVTSASALSALAAGRAEAMEVNPSTTYIPNTEKGAASGVATLDQESKVPIAQIPDLSAAISANAAVPLSVLARGADPTGSIDATQIIQSAINEAAAVSGSGDPGTRKVLLPGCAEVSQPTYLINGRITIPKFVVVEAETGMAKILCGTAKAGIDVGDGISPPFHAELNNVLIDANFIADNPLVYNKASEVYSRRVFTTNLTATGQGIKLADCLGITLESPTISRNSVQPRGTGIGIRVTGVPAGYIVIRDHNFFNLKHGIRFETGVSNLVVNEGWNEWITNYLTVATASFASYGNLTTNNSHFTGTDATHRLFYLERADAGYNITKARWFQNWLAGASNAAALIDLSALANTVGTTRFALDECTWQMGPAATVLSRHAGTPWHQIYVRLRNFDSLPYTKLPRHGSDCQLTSESSQGWSRFANGISVNGDPLRTDGHLRWNTATKRLQVDTTGTGVYSDVPVAGDYSSATGVAGQAAVFAPGSYYTPRGARSALPLTRDRLTIVPFLVPKNQRFVRMGAEVTIGATGSRIRLGIFNIGTDGVPTTLVADVGTIDSASRGAKELNIDVTLPAGLYGLAAVAQGGAPSARTITGGGGLEVGAGSLASSTQSNPNTGFYMSSVAGALPRVFTVTDRSLSPTLVSMRTA